jgi:hypothetical protein
MSILTISGQIINAGGVTLTVLIYDSNNALVFQDYPTTDFTDTPDLPPGDYSMDIFGYTQGSLIFGLSGYQTINPAPPAQYDQRISNIFNFFMV